MKFSGALEFVIIVRLMKCLTSKHCLFILLIALLPWHADGDQRSEVLDATLHPYLGPVVRGVDSSTLSGKLMCGYQGWFNAEGDGAELRWKHWTRDGKAPTADNIRVDLWPDVSELAAEERFATGLLLPGGQPAELFSSFRRETVLRHFRWMREYGIDGAFVQRFITDLRNPRVLANNNTVLGHCREGANSEGRTYSIMYDLSGLGAGRTGDVFEDWRELRTRMKLDADTAYLRHRGKLLVAVWGVGFNDHRAYTVAECRQLVELLKADGCAIMLGVPTYWRELKNDAVSDPALHDLLRLADVISPWTVGRFGDEAGARRYAEKTLADDVAWCRSENIDCLPVVFPGFSWHNMQRGKPLDAIPRRGGDFLWSQFTGAVRAGAEMLYVAMFDEVDEGTAIFKCTNDVPVGKGAEFVTFEGLASDHYLRVSGLGGRLLRREIEPSEKLPLAK